MEKFGIGQAVRRREDARFLTGSGRYLDDLDLPGMTHATFVRSPHAHARIVAVDTAEAKSADGVVAVLTIDDCHAAGLGPIPSMTAIDGIDQASLHHPDHFAFADGVTRYVGEPVAMVVAETRAQALAAAELVMVDYDALPALAETGAALDDDVPEVWPGKGNRAFRFEKGDDTATAAALDGAAHRVSLDLINNRLAPTAIEPRGAIGDYDGDGDAYTLHISGQAVHAQRNQLAAAVFKVAPERMRVVAPDVGGGFGAKNFVYSENILVMLAAKFTGRPVKWISARSEAFLSEIHARDHVTRAELGLDKDLRIVALKVETIANMGAYLSSFGPIIPTAASWVSMGGTYAVPNIHMVVDAVYTNTMPVDAYRGAGRPESAYIMERLMDTAAFDLGIDPADLRRRNFVSAYPYEMALGLAIDCGDFAGTFERALGTAAAARGACDGRLRGIGLSSYLEVTLGLPNETMEIRFGDNDTVTVLAGTQSTGQGHETTYCQIVAEELSLPFDAIRYAQGDTDTIAVGGGHGGSRSLMIGGSALQRTAKQVIAKGRIAAAHVLDVDESEIDFADGLFAVAGSNRRIGLFELERALRASPDLPENIPASLGATGTFERERHSFPNGSHVAQVEVDPETGAVTLLAYAVVDDFGAIVNPMIAAGQVQGGAVQGIGQALWEHVIYDPASAQIVSGSLMDYAMPRADMVPAIDVTFNQDAPSATNPLGVKGAGEAGATGAPAAIVNAVLDALKPLGVRHLDMPLTSEKVWRAIADAGA